jgi:REP element-mobilizing transposase RayT
MSSLAPGTVQVSRRVQRRAWNVALGRLPFGAPGERSVTARRQAVELRAAAVARARPPRVRRVRQWRLPDDLEPRMPHSRRDPARRLHHITARGNDRRSIYEDATDRERFYDILARALDGTAVVCHQDVQMGNHYHLVLEGASEDVSHVLWALNHRYAVSYNARHRCSGHLFGRRYHSAPIADLAGARALVVYVALNPVRAGFVDDPRDWAYGSFRAQIGAEAPRPHLGSGLVDRIFDARTSLADACAAALAEGTGGRPSLATLMPKPSELTRAHVTQAAKIFGFGVEDVAAYYRVSTRTLSRWLAASGARTG